MCVHGGQHVWCCFSCVRIVFSASRSLCGAGKKRRIFWEEEKLNYFYFLLSSTTITHVYWCNKWSLSSLSHLRRLNVAFFMISMSRAILMIYFLFLNFVFDFNQLIIEPCVSKTLEKRNVNFSISKYMRAYTL